MRYYPISIKPPIVQSAIAGIADKFFCQRFLDLDLGMVTLGGYSIDKKTIEATKKMLKRGRKEFLFPKDFSNLRDWFNGNLILRKKRKEQLVAINVRLSQIDEISSFWLKNLHEYVDILELNAHCRQEEIVTIHAGEYLLENLEFLADLLQEIKSLKIKIPLGIKIRGYKIENKKELINLLYDFHLSYIHIDAMIPEKDNFNSTIISEFTRICSLPIIANNSIRSTENVKDMMKLGAIAVSLARPLIKSPSIAKELVESLEGLKNGNRDFNTL